MVAPASRPVFVVDAGHGWAPSEGGYTGAYNTWAGVHEDPLALDIALRVAAALGGLGAEVHLTRTGDQEPADYNGDGEQTNRDRSYFALNLKQVRPEASKPRADAYISIHLNASPYEYKRGTTGVFSEAGPAEGHSLQSARLAMAIHTRLITLLPESAAPFAINGLYMDRLALPHVVVEVAFLTNAADLGWVLDKENRQLAAEQVAQGAMDWWTRFGRWGGPAPGERAPHTSPSR